MQALSYQDSLHERNRTYLDMIFNLIHEECDQVDYREYEAFIDDDHVHYAIVVTQEIGERVLPYLSQSLTRVEERFLSFAREQGDGDSTIEVVCAEDRFSDESIIDGYLFQFEIFLDLEDY